MDAMPERAKGGDGGKADPQQSFLEAPAPNYAGHRQRLRERFRKPWGNKLAVRSCTSTS
jgi:hypothetical protein